MFRFANPVFLLFLLIIPVAIFIKYRKHSNYHGIMKFSSLNLFERIKHSTPFLKRNGVFILLLLSFASFVLAMARPQTESGYANLSTEGVDIVLVLDLSGSMRFVDGIPNFLKPTTEGGTTKVYIDRNGEAENRLDIAKKLLIEFVEKRKQDRLSLVVFSDYPYTECPLTISHDIIIEKLKNIKFTHTKGQSTALGDALVSGINKLTHSESESRIMILITDGNSNKGEDPVKVSHIASDEGIKIYCIGIGGNEKVLRPRAGGDYNNRDWVLYEELSKSDGERLDDITLKEIAENTGGKFFLGSDEDELRDIYKEIDRLEKTESEHENIYINYEEKFPIFILIGVIILSMSFLLENTLLRILP